MLTRSIDSLPTDNGDLHKTWTVTSPAGAIALSVVRTTSHFAKLPTAVRADVAPAGGGQWWVFSAIRTHEPVTETVFGCPQHQGCEMDTIVSSYARPAWQRIVAAGVTDEAIWMELEIIHRAHFTAGGEAA